MEKLPQDNSTGKRSYIEESENSVSYLGVEVPKGEGGPLVPGRRESENYFLTEEDYYLRREIATSLVLNKPLLFEGGTGLGKTTSVSQMCAELNMNYCKVSFGREMAVEDVIGGKDIFFDENGKESFRWCDGNLMVAVRHGGIVLLDEYNYQGSKIGSRVNPIIDAILNGNKFISLPENNNERVAVHPNCRIVAAQNPPGTEEGQEFTGRDILSPETFGRFTFHKMPLFMTNEMRNKRMAGMMGEDVAVDIPKEDFRRLGEGIPLRELHAVEGMTHWRREAIGIIDVLISKTGKGRGMAEDQKQKIYFNPRLEQGLLNYVSKFYRGDVNEVWQNAFEHMVVGMYKSEADKTSIREMLLLARFSPPQADSKRKSLEDTDDAPEKSGEVTAASPEAGRGKVSLEEAEKVMGSNFLGPKAVESAFGGKFGPSEKMPAIPFSKDELVRAKELGQQLILYVDKTPAGASLTMEEMNKQRGEKAADGKKLLYDTDWYKNEEFFKKETTKKGWRLTSEEIIADSTSKNYLEQIEALIDHLRNKVFKGRSLSKEYEEAIREFDKKKASIASLISSDWKKASEELEKLKITQMTRETPAEILYRLILSEKKTGKKSLPSTYTWTCGRASDGLLVFVGYFDSDGVIVYGDAPDSADGYLGVCFSRT